MPGVRASNFSKVLRTDSPGPASGAVREEKNSAMNIRHRIEGNTLVVKILTARLDAESAPEIKRRLGDWIRSGHRRLVLDVADVEFIDSSGLHTLVFALKQLASYQDLAISGPRDALLNMFKLTRLYQIFNIFSDSHEAIAALSSGAAPHPQRDNARI
jgi:anti-sigma B factor antagonist